MYEKAEAESCDFEDYEDHNEASSGRVITRKSTRQAKSPENIPSSGKAKYLSAQERPLDVFVDPIRSALPEHAREKYLAVQMDVRKWLVQGLRDTLRWQNSPQNIDPDFHENDLQHTLELVEWCNEIEQKYPELYAEISENNLDLWHELLAMLVVHDVGEIRLGDVCLPNQQTEEGRKRKALEPRWAKFLFYKALPQAEAKKIVSLYNRFEELGEGDRVAMLAKAMDKAQASANVAKHIIPFNNGDDGYSVESEFFQSQADTLQYVDRLLDMLDNPEAKRQLFKFFEEKVLDHFAALDLPEIDRLRTDIRQRFANVDSISKV